MFDSVVTVRTVAVLLSRDGVVERLEDFVSVLSSTSSDALLSSTRATVTIGDEDRGEISVVSESESVPEGSAVRFTVELGDGVTASEDLSVSWSVDCSGSVTSVDFAGFGDVCPSGTVLITSGSTSSVITVMTNDDELREGDERFTLSLTEVLPSIEGRISISTVSTASVTIEANDEDGSIVEIGFLPTDYRVLESAGIVTLTVSVLSGNILTGSVTVLVTTSDGSAVAGEDYTSVSESLVFDSVVTVRTVAVLLSRDGVVERLEDFVSVLSSTSSDALLSSTRATVTIGDEDRGEISVVSESESVPEGSAVRFTVELGDGVTASEDLSVSWSVDCSGSVTSVDFVVVVHRGLF